MTASPGFGTSRPLTLAGWLAGVLLRWRTVIATAVVTLALALLSTLVFAPRYRSTASFVSNTTSAGLKLPSSLSSVAGLSGLASQLGAAGGDASESPAFYAELLDSRELLTRLVRSRYHDPRSANPADSADLVRLFKVKKKDPARALEVAVQAAGKAMSITSDARTNLVTVTVDAEWPELSAAIANRATALVSEFNQEQRVARARGKREFVEGRLQLAQRELVGAEARLRDFNDSNRGYRASANLLFEQQQLQRQVDVATDMYLTLRHEYETARLTEVNDAPIITPVDSAVAPRRALWPRYTVLIPAAIIVGLMLGVLVAGAAEIGAAWARDNASDAAQLRAALGRVRGDRDSHASAAPIASGTTSPDAGVALPPVVGRR